MCRRSGAETAVDVEHRAGDVARLVRGQERDGVGLILRLAKPAQGHADAERQDARGRENPRRPPVEPCHGREHEVGAGPQLVRQRESDAAVGVQVKQIFILFQISKTKGVA